jgi:hypothetical protein
MGLPGDEVLETFHTLDKRLQERKAANGLPEPGESLTWRSLDVDLTGKRHE